MMRIVAAVTLLISVVAAQMVGGWTTQNASDKDYMDRAWKSLKGINEDSSNNGPYHMIPIKVVSAKSQVVAGVNHEFEVLVGESTCKKGEVTASQLSAADCQLKEDPQRALYKVTLWEKPWENFEEFKVSKIRSVEASEQI